MYLQKVLVIGPVLCSLQLNLLSAIMRWDVWTLKVHVGDEKSIHNCNWILKLERTWYM
jgi:hypothetical protein